MAERSRDPLPAALARLLEERELTPAELCRKAQVSPGAVSRYLSGTRGSRLNSRGARTIERVAGALEIEPDYFREYRAWRIREIAAADPSLLDDCYDLVVQAAKRHGLIQGGGMRRGA